MTNNLMETCNLFLELDLNAPENYEQVQKIIEALPVDSLFYVNQFFDSEIEKNDAAAAEYMKKVDTLAKVQKTLHARALDALKKTGLKKIETASGNIIKIKETESVEIYDANALPSWAISKEIKQVVEEKIDKRIIKDALNNGQEVSGARIKINEKVEFK